MQSAGAAGRHSRRKPDLFINTSASASFRGKLASARALKVPPPTQEAADMETFLDSFDSIDMADKEKDDSAGPAARPAIIHDSHDLSLSPRNVTRDSLVANMLLSLDQISVGMDQSEAAFGASRVCFDDPAVFPSCGVDDGRATAVNSRTGRSSNGHGYSYSSDLDGTDDLSRVSSQPSRGRRSNSSSGFQSSLGRINSTRDTTNPQSGIPPGTARAMQAKGTKRSNSNCAASLDAGYVQPPGSHSQLSAQQGRTFTITSNTPSNACFDDDEYEAAPTPTVPVGPRRLAMVPSLPVLPLLLPEPSPARRAPEPERQRSTRSSKSATVGRIAALAYANSSDVPDVPDVPRVPSVPDVPDVPSVPPVPPRELEAESAPAPHIRYEKNKKAVQTPSAPTSVSQSVKDKPGFFRRMFAGVSKNGTASTSNSPLPAASSPAPSSMSVETGGPWFNAASQMKPAPMPPPPPPPPRESHGAATQSLQKKPSFFRRRKHSTAGFETHPPLPGAAATPPGSADVPLPVQFPTPNKPSPTTSLRRAMDPYLHSSPNTSKTNSPLSSVAVYAPASAGDKASPRLEGKEPVSEQHGTRGVRCFSPNYERSPKAVIRTVGPRVDKPGVRPEACSQAAMPSRQPPVPPVPGTSSFLQDNSDSDSSPQKRRATVARAASHDQTLKPVAADEPRRSPSPTMSKARSSPNLRLSRDLASHVSANTVSTHENRNDADNSMLPLEGARAGDDLPGLRINTVDESPNKPSHTIDEPHFITGDPTEDDCQKAQNIFDGNEAFIQKEKAASWMGEEGPIRQRTLRAYMDLFDFKNQSIIASLRQICNRLVLRAETQQIDRILVAFSRRWCACNPNHGFKATGLATTSPRLHMEEAWLTLCYRRHSYHLLLHHAAQHRPPSGRRRSKDDEEPVRQEHHDHDPPLAGRFSFRRRPPQHPSWQAGASSVRRGHAHICRRAPGRRAPEQLSGLLQSTIACRFCSWRCR